MSVAHICFQRIELRRLASHRFHGSKAEGSEVCIHGIDRLSMLVIVNSARYQL